MLKDDEYDPYSKLLALRFIKDSFCYVSYGFLTLINSILTDLFL
jgi:hypothetical protein